MSYEIPRGQDLEDDLGARLRAAMNAAEPKVRFFNELAELASVGVKCFRPLGGHTQLRILIQLAEAVDCDLVDLLPPGGRRRPRNGERPRLTLGAVAFEDARKVDSARWDGRRQGGNAAPLSLPEIGKATGFSGLRLERAIAASDVLTGRLTVWAEGTP